MTGLGEEKNDLCLRTALDDGKKMKKGGKTARYRKKSKPRSRPSEEDDDLLVRILNQKVAADVSLSQVTSPSSARQPSCESPPKQPLCPSQHPNQSSGEQSSALFSQLAASQRELQDCRRDYQQSLNVLKTALAEVQQTVARRNEEVATVVTRCVQDLETIAAAAEGKRTLRDVISRLNRLISADFPIGNEGKTTDRSLAPTIEQCKARLDSLRSDFLALKEQKTRLETDFRLQLAQKDDEIASLRTQIADLQSEIRQKSPSHPSREWDLPLQMRCFSAAVSPEKSAGDSETEEGTGKRG